MFNTFTKAQLLSDLRNYDDKLIVVIAINYGDRSSTMQAIPATNVGQAFIKESGYSDSGYRIVEEGDEDTGTILSLNLDDISGIDQAFSVKELISELSSDYDDDMLVAMGVDYGDRNHTIQAIAISELNEAYIEKTSYSESGYKLVEDGDQDDESIQVVVLNYNMI